MQQKSKSLLLSLSVVALSAAVVAISVSNNSSFSKTKANVNTVTLDSNDLSNVSLEEINLKGEGQANDRKFRIALANNRYIDGAIVFQDCGLQYTGSTLGDFFGIDNTSSSSANAYNFQILFSLEKTSELSISINEQASTSNSSVYTLFHLKYGNFGGASFYDNIRNNYSKVVSTASEAQYYYSSDVFSTDYITMDAASKNKNNYGLAGSNFTVACLQVKYGVEDGQSADKYFVQAGQWIKFALTSLSISFECN